MGISLGKTNYCLKALVGRGFIKFQNFYNNKKKSAYVYYLTPKGIEEKTEVTYRFLQRKIKEFEDIKVEIEKLQIETAITKDTKESKIDL